MRSHQIVRSSAIAIVATVALLASSVATAGDATFKLRRGGKVGSSYTMKIVAVADLEGEELRFESIVEEKLTKLEKDGSHTTTSTLTGGKSSFGGEEEEMDPGDPETNHYGPRGNWKAQDVESEDDVDEDSNRMASVLSLIYPEKEVKVGDKWEYELKSNDKLSTKDVTYNYELVSTEKMDGMTVAKLKFVAKETEGEDPVSAEGFVWIDVADGTMVKGDATIKNVPFGGEALPFEMKVTAERVKAGSEESKE
ncbi:MAG: hypothetical protein JNM85_08495 [Chthonomonas sp.]|nr:hypothetical protein [Chthonomonas sp.]